MVGPINGCSVLGGPPCGLAGLSRGCFSFRFAGHEPQQAETTLCTKSKGSLLLLVVVVGGCWLLVVGCWQSKGWHARSLRFCARVQLFLLFLAFTETVNMNMTTLIIKR